MIINIIIILEMMAMMLTTRLNGQDFLLVGCRPWQGTIEDEGYRVHALGLHTGAYGCIWAHMA